VSLEVERKFLVGAAPDWLEGCESAPIQQGYVALDGDTEVRVRRFGEERWLTVKHGGGLVRAEIEVELDADRFEQLWALTDGRRVSKRRYVVASEHRSFDVDVYEEDLAGLIVAEVEFDSVDLSAAFEPPPWLGDEVTDDDRYKNRRLAEHGRPH
jgi:CYTH domain-containing protein